MHTRSLGEKGGGCEMSIVMLWKLRILNEIWKLENISNRCKRDGGGGSYLKFYKMRLEECNWIVHQSSISRITWYVWIYLLNSLELFFLITCNSRSSCFHLQGSQSLFTPDNSNFNSGLFHARILVHFLRT